MSSNQHREQQSNYISAIATAILTVIGEIGLVLGKLVPLNEATQPWLLGAGLFGMVGGALIGSRIEKPTSQQLWLAVVAGLVSVFVINVIVLKNYVFPGFESVLALLTFVMTGALGFLFSRLVRPQ